MLTSIKWLRTTAEGRSLGVLLVTLVLFGVCAKVAGLNEGHPQWTAFEPAGNKDRVWAGRLPPNPQRQNKSNDGSPQDDTNVVTDKTTQWMWRRVIDEKSFTREDANTYCKDLVAAGDE